MVSHWMNDGPLSLLVIVSDDQDRSYDTMRSQKAKAFATTINVPDCQVKGFY